MPEAPKGRGSNLNPPNRFGGPYHVQDLEQVENDEEYLAGLGKPATEYIPDKTRSVVSKNDSPDVGFRYSVNPYRGCSHGCAYCYARPTHEYLGLNAGLDFETKILVKHDAPRAAARVSLARRLGAGIHRALGGDRSLPARGTAVRHYARLHRSGCRSPPADQHHHEERLGGSRPGPSERDGTSKPGSREHERHDAERRARALDGAANERRKLVCVRSES